MNPAPTPTAAGERALALFEDMAVERYDLLMQARRRRGWREKDDGLRSRSGNLNAMLWDKYQPHTEAAFKAIHRKNLLIRLTACASALEQIAAEAADDYQAYYADRAAQCRKWIADLQEGYPVKDEVISGAWKFEAMVAKQAPDTWLNAWQEAMEL